MWCAVLWCAVVMHTSGELGTATSGDVMRLHVGTCQQSMGKGKVYMCADVTVTLCM